MTSKTLAGFTLALIGAGLAIALTASVAQARSRHHHHHSARSSSSSADRLAALTSELAAMRRELAMFRQALRPGLASSSADATTIFAKDDQPPQNNAVVASLIDLPKEPAANPKSPARLGPVMPATAVQRGQFGDRRRTHRHAGIDLGGVYGSPIVASFAGRVLPAPGGDRGYGPHVLVIRGDDDIVYRYAHLASVSVKTGQHVATGQTIGTMGKVGRHGFVHLHFEMMRLAEYRRRPYGLHSLDPNDYLGGGRGKRMAAGEPMRGQAATRYAAAH